MSEKELPVRFFMGDIVVYLTILLLVALSFLLLKSNSSEDKPIAVITKNGVELYRIDLEKATGPKEIKIEGTVTSLIEVEEGKIRFKDSDCPEKICVKTGWISRPGQVAVCLPGGVVIKIIGENQYEEMIDIYLR